ncbi:MAG: hypothetical protein L6U99_08920 [Clostridium sp.]|nr:MAG: hypothetical protein L6U99_08920 [Clostridium sp.]
MFNWRELFIIKKKLSKKFVDTNEPRAIIVYSVASDETTYALLQYAIDKGVKKFML